MGLFTREASPPAPQSVLELVPGLIAETNRLFRTGKGKQGHLLEKLVERGDVQRFNPNWVIQNEWMRTLPGVLTDGQPFDSADVYFQIVRRGRTRKLLFKSHALLGTGADLREWVLELHPNREPQIRYIVRKGNSDPQMVSYTQLPDRQHFRWTLALIATAQQMP